MIQSVSNGYYGYQNIAPMQNTAYSAPMFAMQPQQPNADTLQFRGQQQPEEESFISRNLGKILIGGLAIAAGAYFTHGKLWGKAAEEVAENTAKDVAKGEKGAIQGAEEAAGKAAGKAAGELSELIKKRESAQGEDLIDITQNIIKKTTDEDVLLAENHKLLEYLEKAEKGELPLKKNSIRGIATCSPIPAEKEDAFEAIADIHAKRGNNSEALSFYQKALDVEGGLCGGDARWIPTMMQLFTKENRTDEGIALAVKHLENRKNDAAGDFQVNLIQALAEGLKTKGKTELAESFELLTKGHYHHDQLTAEDFGKLAKVGLTKEQVATLTGGAGRGGAGREETGAMTKWVLEQVQPKA